MFCSNYVLAAILYLFFIVYVLVITFTISYFAMFPSDLSIYRCNSYYIIFALFRIMLHSRYILSCDVFLSRYNSFICLCLFINITFTWLFVCLVIFILFMIDIYSEIYFILIKYIFKIILYEFMFILTMHT